MLISSIVKRLQPICRYTLDIVFIMVKTVIKEELLTHVLWKEDQNKHFIINLLFPKDIP